MREDAFLANREIEQTLNSDITISDRIKLVLNDRRFLILEVLAFSVCFAAGQSVWGVKLGLLLLAATLWTSSDLFTTLTPLLLTSMTVLKHYGGMPSDYLDAIPYAVLTIAAFVLHFVRFPIAFTTDRAGRYPLKTGKLFAAKCAVALAVILGGTGLVRFTEYFSIRNLYYILGLGPCMVLLYVAVRTYVGTDRELSPRNLITDAMCAVCLMGILMWLSESIPNYREGNFQFYVQWKNNLSTFLLLAFPFAFYRARTSKFSLLYHILGMSAAAVCMLTNSRGGMMFGVVILIACLIFGIVFQGGKTRERIGGKGAGAHVLFNVRLHCSITLGVILIGGVVYVITHPELLEILSKMLEIKPEESRWGLIRLACENFIKNPFLGVGLGYVGPGNHPAGFAMYWYHSTPFQIIGSMGIVGIVAYVWQFFARIWVLGERRSFFNLAILLSFGGFELMALVNPGDFCPFPYVYMLSVLFAASEWHGEQKEDKRELLSFDGVHYLPFVGLPTLSQMREGYLSRKSDCSRTIGKKK